MPDEFPEGGVEKALPPEAGAAGPENGPGARTDGLAAAIAGEFGAGPGAPGSDPGAGGRKRGRPPVHGGYSQANGSDGKRRVPVDFPGEIPPGNAGEIPRGALENRPAPRVVVPPDLLAKVIREGLDFGERFAATKLGTVAQAAGLTPDDVAPQLAQAQLGETRKGLVAELTPLALQEWGVDAEMSPTCALLLLLGPWAFGAWSAYGELARLAQEKAERDKARETKHTVLATEARA
jgi:hypothetical protein